MNPNIHPHAIIQGEVIFKGSEYTIGPYAVLGYDYSEKRSVFHSNGYIKKDKKPLLVGANVFIGSHAIISSGCTIEDKTIIEHQCFIGEESIIGEDSFIRYQSQIYQRVKIGRNCVIGGFLCNDSIIENNVHFFGKTIHVYLNRKSEGRDPAPVIKKGAFIGQNALIVGGVTIGKESVIKAGAIILKSVPENSIVAAGEVFRD